MSEERTNCTFPPKGWRCSRGEGHDGPCAAELAPLTVDDLIEMGSRVKVPQISPAASYDDVEYILAEILTEARGEPSVGRTERSLAKSALKRLIEVGMMLTLNVEIRK